ncbi:dipeptide ABC transporter ATP-binding protein [Galactobacter caseinivorans]|uniref:ABC transporter ATP-binding protein n=1 Tax=Galactobacter caseinivorans TaxID=2676123 RepID=A0A496PM34_9MICC|nr:ABC transporter ATP-binding protein [Galactobacter caseinivorans]RKW71573.1 ABC transporter ATP-binding protein [Galactobacter caseinivorans]
MSEGLNFSKNDAAEEETPLLQVRDLEVTFKTVGGDVQAVRGVSFELYQGENLAIVGESGSGKSTTATAILDLLAANGRVSGGSALFDGKDLTKLSRKEMEHIRGREIGYVPQDPMSNLNPVWNIGFQVRETIEANSELRGRAAKARTVEVLKEAGLPDPAGRLRQYPNQFSGGMRQRVLIGIGMSARPKLLVADEPTSALDVTVQRRILDHIGTLTSEYGTSVMFITHDLGLAAERAERLVVMYKGQVVEYGSSQEILANPQHPYTQRLVAAAPSLASRRIQNDVAGKSSPTESAEVKQVSLDKLAKPHVVKGEPLIKVQNVTKVYEISQGGFKKTKFKAVDDVSFEIRKGSTMAIVGESGSGKSTIAKLFLKLEDITSGTMTFDGEDVGSLPKNKLLAFRRRVQPVFQDPYGTLDPMASIGSSIAEPLLTHKIGTPKSRRKTVAELLDQVSLPAATAARYPNELSGGQRQRIAIARALALKPDVLVLDEAVSALDVLVQAQVLNLLSDLQAELDLTYLFITHDLGVVRMVADDVTVMRQGEVVEAATVDEVFENPKEQYTRDLLEAIPGANFEFGKSA